MIPLLLLALHAPFVTSVSASTGVIDEHWSAPRPTQSGQLGVIFDDRVDFFYVGALTAAIPGNGTKWRSQICKSVDDTNCASATYFAYKAMLEPCSSTTTKDCVSRVRAHKPDGTFEDATFHRYVTDDENTYWQGTLQSNLPNSRAEGIWRFPTIKHDAGQDFLVAPLLDGIYERGELPRVYRLQTTLQPVSELRDPSVSRVKAQSVDVDFMSYERLVQSKGGWTGGMQGMPEKNCAATADGICYRREAFPSEIDFEVTIRLSGKLNGWIHGRLTEPTVSISDVSGVQEISVRGRPIQVPVVAYWSDQNSLPSNIQQEYATKAPTTIGLSSGGTSNRFQTNGQFDKEAIRLFNLWIPFIQDKADANPSVWVYGSLSPDTFENSARAFNGGSSCLKGDSGLMGLVTTNATIYDGGMPEFDRQEQTLNYQVSAPHFAANGKEFLGSYSLLMRSELARCIYGFSSAPVKATIEIASTDGTNRVAATTLNEREGWLSLGAYGFTYSSPVIKVKLQQDSQTSPSPSPIPSPTPRQAESDEVAESKPVSSIKNELNLVTKITCVKGNKTKVFKTGRVKCPKGYKKK